MEIGLIVCGALLLILPGIWGIWRGVKAGLFVLTGTLLAAVVVNLWGSWIRERIGSDDGTGMVFAATSAGFLLIILTMGYGGSLLFARPPKTRRSEQSFSLAHTGLGGLVGLLNGLIIFSFLLYYGVELGHADIIAAVGNNALLALAYAWLSWYMLAVGLTMSVWIMARLLVRLIQKLTARQAGAKTGSAYAEHPAQAGRLQGISSKIDQALGESSRRR